MADVIRIKRRAAGGAAGAPASLANAELAYNEQDHTLYIGEGTGGAGGSATVIRPIAGNGLVANYQPLDDDLTTIAGLTGTSTIYYRSGTGAWTAVAIGSGLSFTAGTLAASGGGGNVSNSGTPTNGQLASWTNANQIQGININSIRLDQWAVPTANIAFGSMRITGLADPQGAQDAATKNYVDTTVQGLQIKPTARLATAAALPANTYANGTAGLGATLTATANAALSVDGVAVAVNDVILVKNQVAAAQNGLYTVTQAGSGVLPYILTRHVDMDVAGDYSGAFIPVGGGGATNANTLWLANPTTPVTPGTTTIPLTQLNAATSYVAGNGLTLTGNVIDVVGTTNRISVAADAIDISTAYVGQTSITTLGTITSGVWQGTAIAQAYVVGLGTMASQNANAVAITGGTIDGVTLDGGTF